MRSICRAIVNCYILYYLPQGFFLGQNIFSLPVLINLLNMKISKSKIMSTTIPPRKKNKADEDCLDEGLCKFNTGGVGEASASTMLKHFS